MNNRGAIWFFGGLSIVLAAAVICMSFFCWNTPVFVGKGQKEVPIQTAAFLDTVKAGDPQRISEFFSVETDLADMLCLSDTAPGRLYPQVWQQMEYTVLTHGYGEDGNLAVQISITMPNAATVLENMQPLVSSILNEKVNSAEDLDKVYDAENHYLPDFMAQVTCEAVDAALAQASTRTETVKVHWQMVDGIWKILPEDAIIGVLSGWVRG